MTAINPHLEEDKKAARKFLPKGWRLGNWVPVRKGRIDWHKIGIREYLIKRQRGLCYWCGEPMLIYGERDLLATIEHVIPISKGGRDHPNNIKMAHKRCNEKRGSEWPTDRRVAQLTSHDQNRR